MIYSVPNSITSLNDYICPDQATIDQGEQMGYKGTFVIGDLQTANDTLSLNRQNFINKNINLFTVNKDINPDPNTITWVLCDLNTEEQNNDIDYYIFSPANGQYSLTTGLDNAKALLIQTKENFADTCGPVGITQFEAWTPIAQDTIITGLQTL